MYIQLRSTSCVYKCKSDQTLALSRHTKGGSASSKSGTSTMHLNVFVVKRQLHYVAFRTYAHAFTKTNGGSASSKSGTSIMHLNVIVVKRQLHYVALRPYAHTLGKTNGGSASSKSGTSIMHLNVIVVKRQLHYVAFRAYARALSKTNGRSASSRSGISIMHLNPRNEMCIGQRMGATIFAGQLTLHWTWLGNWRDLANTRHDNMTQNCIPCKHNTTPVGFEPTRGDPIGLAGRRLNRSAKVSVTAWCGRQSTTSSAERTLAIIDLICPWPPIH